MKVLYLYEDGKNPVDATSFKIINGAEYFLRLPIVLSIASILLALSISTLAMESSLSRVSFRKMNIMIILIALQVRFLMTSQILVFIELQESLNIRLQWLKWLPACLLFIGISLALFDALKTAHSIYESRINWIPLSSMHENGIYIELTYMLVTVILVTILIGWRKGSWWKSFPITDSYTVVRKSKSNVAFGNVSFSICVLGALTSLLLRYGRFWIQFLGEFATKPFTKRNVPREVSSTLLDHQEKIFSISFAGYEENDLSKQEKEEYLSAQPLHIGNMIVGKDQTAFGKAKFRNVFFENLPFLIFEKLGVVLLILITVVGISKAYKKIDEDMLRVLEALSDSVTVLSFSEIAYTLRIVLKVFEISIGSSRDFSATEKELNLRLLKKAI